MLTVSKLVSDGQPSKGDDMRHSDEEQLLVTPNELIICGPLDECAYKKLTLTNGHERKRIAFRFPQRYEATPSMGVLLPGGSVDVTIVLIPRSFIANYFSNKPEVVIDWLLIADAVLSSDGYEDEFIWTGNLVGLRSKTVKMSFKRKAIPLENKRDVMAMPPASIDVEAGKGKLLSDNINQRVQELEKEVAEVKKLLAESKRDVRKYGGCLFLLTLLCFANLLAVIIGVNYSY